MAKSSNKSVVPEAREALNRFKMEAANKVGVQSPLEENIHIL
ncbi:MAG: small, acid-soluble spore protein, alpha/beta type [Clostridia bacterium]|nr:small, acid-soluble spore protein, alpha/beta type [Clostridia bacterium]